MTPAFALVYKPEMDIRFPASDAGQQPRARFLKVLTTSAPNTFIAVAWSNVAQMQPAGYELIDFG